MKTPEERIAELENKLNELEELLTHTIVNVANMSEIMQVTATRLVALEAEVYEP